MKLRVLQSCYALRSSKPGQDSTHVGGNWDINMDMTNESGRRLKDPVKVPYYARWKTAVRTEQQSLLKCHTEVRIRGGENDIRKSLSPALV